jgi:tetratricopeptide (TPR) repeat protein
MTYIHPLWNDPPSEEKEALGKVSAQRAMSLATTDRERAYGSAVAAYYANPGIPEPEKLAAFHDGWSKAKDQDPDDNEARLFYGLTKLSIASRSDKTYATQLEVGALAEEVLKTIPDHPGAFHYAIHAYDVPALADKALYVASNYGKIAPEIPHALHMPSHIFTRLGHWDESISWNMRSAKAASALNAQGVRSMHLFHALDYIAYARLQKGDDAGARAVLASIDTMDSKFQTSPATAYALAAIPARLALERGQWKEAAMLTPPYSDKFSWDQFPAFGTITYFGKGIGAARSKDASGVATALERMDSLIVVLEGSKTYGYWAEQARIQRLAITAWAAYERGDHADGLAMMKEATDKEAATDKHPITPGEILPAAEMYGDMLMLAGKPKDALAQYRIALTRSPNRLNSLYGAARAAEALGDKEAARTYYMSLVQMTESSPLESLKHARDAVKSM